MAKKKKPVERTIIVVDMDMTLCHEAWRHHLWKSGVPLQQRYDEYYIHCINDKPISEHVRWIQQLYEAGYEIVILTARSEICRALSEQWLKDNNVPYHRLVMRCDEDRRRGFQVKEDELKLIGLDKIRFCLEDNPDVIYMMVGLGLLVYDAAQKRWV